MSKYIVGASLLLSNGGIAALVGTVNVGRVGHADVSCCGNLIFPCPRSARPYQTMRRA
ncbi:hypothetical protein V1293_006683 [Bradyrhizobium sp. AZCC 1693]